MGSVVRGDSSQAVDQTHRLTQRGRRVPVRVQNDREFDGPIRRRQAWLQVLIAESS